VAAASCLEGGPPSLDSPTDRLLIAGARIAARTRRALRDRLGYTASAGVAANKLLAKIGSARNKPDKQTVVLQRGVGALMQVGGAGVWGGWVGVGGFGVWGLGSTAVQYKNELMSVDTTKQQPQTEPSNCNHTPNHKDMPLTKIKGLGGKLGTRLTEGLATATASRAGAATTAPSQAAAAAGVPAAATAGQVAAAPWSLLVKLLGDQERAR